jgi:methylated-DNA-[protein]-cysteine S-methyltransferase
VAVSVAFGSLDSPVGVLTVAVTEEGLCALGWGRRPPATPGLHVVDDPGRTAPALDRLAAYFGGHEADFDLPIDWRFTGRSQRTILERLYDTVRYGRTVTYGGLAAGTTVPARGIGSIMGSNPIPIVIPCHRVIGGDGLGGYSGAGGVEVKRWLLTLEGAVPATLDWSPDGPTPP